MRVRWVLAAFAVASPFALLVTALDQHAADASTPKPLPDDPRSNGCATIAGLPLGSKASLLRMREPSLCRAREGVGVVRCLRVGGTEAFAIRATHHADTDRVAFRIVRLAPATDDAGPSVSADLQFERVVSRDEWNALIARIATMEKVSPTSELGDWIAETNIDGAYAMRSQSDGVVRPACRHLFELTDNPDAGGWALDEWGPPFNRAAAAAALGGVNVAACKRKEGATGSAKVRVTFARTGVVTDATFAEGTYAGTPVGKCILDRFRAIRIPAFGGGPVTAGKSFSID